MRRSQLRFLLCSAALCACPALCQSATQPWSVPPSTPHDSRTQIPAPRLNINPAITVVIPHNPTLLSRNSTCYVIESRQFPQTASNFNPNAPTTRSVCQSATQSHLKDATATPAR